MYEIDKKIFYYLELFSMKYCMIYIIIYTEYDTSSMHTLFFNLIIN